MKCTYGTRAVGSGADEPHWGLQSRSRSQPPPSSFEGPVPNSLHGSINDVCSSACTQAVIANFDACNGMKDLVDENAGAVDVERVCMSSNGSDDHCSEVGDYGVLDGTAEQEQECADAGPTCTSIYSDRSMQTLYDDSDHGLAEHLEAIVTGCTAWKNGGHYDLDAITGGTR